LRSFGVNWQGRYYFIKRNGKTHLIENKPAEIANTYPTRKGVWALGY